MSKPPDCDLTRLLREALNAEEHDYQNPWAFAYDRIEAALGLLEHAWEDHQTAPGKSRVMRVLVVPLTKETPSHVNGYSTGANRLSYD